MQDNLQRVIQDCEPENLSIQINNRFDKFNLIQQKPGTNYDLEHLNKGEAKFITLLSRYDNVFAKNKFYV